MKWVSVETKLPDDETEVLITDGKHVKQGCFLKWHSGDSWGEPIYFRKVTHWVKLPEPPKTP